MEKNIRPLILVSNDDSIEANGVHALIDVLVNFGDVVAVCPAHPQSGQSMALTVATPLRITRVEDYKDAKMYKVNGTPVDCIKLAMHTVLDRKPDLVVSGINHGSNASINVIYSGTMGAAFEGCAFGIPAIGFSLTDHSPNADFTPCLPFIHKIVKSVLDNGLPQGVALNVNIPNSIPHPTEMRVTKDARQTGATNIENIPTLGEGRSICSPESLSMKSLTTPTLMNGAFLMALFPLCQWHLTGQHHPILTRF